MYLEKAIIAKQELDALKPIEKGLEERVLQKMRLDWNYHSNSIEGNSLTYGETKSLILHHITADGKPLRDHFEITGHNEALLWVMDIVKSERSINENFIRELHKLILKENYFKEAITPDGKPTKKEIKVGEYKTESNHVKTVTGEIFYFAEPHEVKAMMTDLLDWYNEQEKNKNINSIILATEFHYKFIRIHPFDDGNGRMARILMNFILMKHGYHPAIIKKETKEDYFKALRQADAGNIEPFVNYIAESVYLSLILMINAIKGLPFDDDNDVDKQFWMLEQKIKGLGEQTKNFKSKEFISKIINESLIKLYKMFVKHGKKFTDYYFKTTPSVFYSKDPKSLLLVKRENYFVKIDLFTLEHLNTISTLKFEIIFSDFNRHGENSFSYYQSLVVNFEHSQYEVNYNGGIIKKNYSENLTNEEFKTIIDKLTQDHIKHIEQQISNNQ